MHLSKLVYSKNYFSLSEIIVLGLFQIMANQTESSRLERKSVIKFLIADKCKLCEIYRMYDIYR